MEYLLNKVDSRLVTLDTFFSKTTQNGIVYLFSPPPVEARQGEHITHSYDQ